jgi:hypothetical protein
MKHPSEQELSFFERRLARELVGIEDKIKALESEALTLRKQLAKAQSERSGLLTATRKNSLNRVLAENSVLEGLRDKKGPLSTAYLYRRAKNTNPDLRENTFRTYLHRMKKRDLIKTASRAGEWELDKDGINVTNTHVG